MIIKSYLAYPSPGKCDEVTQLLKQTAGCDVIPATNQDVLVLVTESVDEQGENVLTERLKHIPDLQSLTLVSGFNEPVKGQTSLC